ncbi:isocyanide synthase family protein [Streptomyces sp. ISL-22]|uniref:L-tyrosine/L-tryptophan isonitrile synthase family protein n=1 Tax=unclassified Streptomyces TaxID=2593676 RepID=UPI001BE97E3A|nr:MULTISPECIES: isocyanide synthase family protein [unclassified Streptomyces]MBT2416273.1 isocyanide synthase family protein [Streptomyces sp. ISL-24]MBT2437450.1 isocyanide synthase family protein [Streptomyces sp. ISL-22]
MPLTTAPDTLPQTTGAAILNLLLPHHRTTDEAPVPVPVPVPASAEAFPHQLRRITDFVRAGAPIVFTLPGFPCKSPNPAKTLGHLPDMGERLSLTFLDTLCARIERIHPPGARVVICSDGHVFGDLIRVPDDRIDAYSDELRALIRQSDLHRLSVFDLRDVLGDLPPDAGRAHVHDRYAPTLDALRAEVRTDATALALYRGITRFLVEDTAGFTGTRSALQRECRGRAYGVIQRSRAWGALIADHHPSAVRLSIHPQPAGAAKFGIRLLDAPDVWTTPWHSAALREPDGTWTLMPRARAARLGRLVHRDGRPSHFERSSADGHRSFATVRR